MCIVVTSTLSQGRARGDLTSFRIGMLMSLPPGSSACAVFRLHQREGRRFAGGGAGFAALASE
jgi:hypothetical protein